MSEFNRHYVVEAFIDRYLMPFIIGVVATVVAGAILWRLGFV